MDNGEVLKMMQVILQQQAQMYEQQMKKLFEVVADSQVNVGSNVKTISKLNIPNFSGLPNEDVTSWLFLAEQNMAAAGIYGNQRALVIGGYLRDSALQWYRRQCQLNSVLDWEGLSEQLVRMFTPANHQEKLRVEIDRLVQRNGISLYVSEFMKLMNQVMGMSEVDQVHAFIRGLAPRTKAEVGYQAPKTLEDAIRIATDYENHFFKTPKYGPSKWSWRRSHGEPTRMEPQSEMMDINMVGKPDEKRRSWKGKDKVSRDLIKCFNCHEMGHKAFVCPKKNKTVHQQYFSVSDKVDSQLLQFNGHIEGRLVKCVLDTGAVKSVLSKKAAERLGITILPTEIDIKMADGSIVKPDGVSGNLLYETLNTCCRLKFIVTNMDKHDVLLGLDWFSQTEAVFDPARKLVTFPAKTYYLGKEQSEAGTNEVDVEDRDVCLAELDSTDDQMIEGSEDWNDLKTAVEFVNLDPSLSTEEAAGVKALFTKHPAVYARSIKDLGICKIGKHKIRLLNDTPILVPPYRKSVSERKAIQEEVKEMLDAGIIRPSTSPWAFPVILVPKRDKSKRFCIDFRKLNAMTQTDSFPIPRIDDILDRFQGSVWFSKLDLKSGYWQIALDEESIEKTAFSTPEGHYEFVRLPFGIKNAPAEFSRIMMRIMGGLSYVEIYLDDITVHSKSFSEHMMHLETVFQKLIEANLKLNMSKCSLARKSIHVLGHIIENNCIKMDPEKTKAVECLRTPESVKELQTFLGLTGYYRKFVKGYSEIAAPLFGLLKKDKGWDWTPSCQEAFMLLKSKLTEYPILRMPDLSRKFQVYTDASGLAIGAILSQRDEEGREYVCCYSSRLLKGAEIHYGISEKECLAVVWAIRMYRPYLYGEKFEVITDHSALKWLMNIHDPTGRLARWALYLQAYEFEIIHRKGTQHSNVDPLSRSVFMLESTSEGTDATDISTKVLDPWEDYALMHFLGQGKHQPGTSKRQCKRIERLRAVYKLENGRLYFRKDADKETKWLQIPKRQERWDIIRKAHLLGHFQLESTLARMREKFHWKKMAEDTRKYIDNCLPCLRHQNSPQLEHAAKALPITGTFDRIGLDLILGLPETTEGFVGALVMVEYLTNFPFVVPIKSKTAKEISSHLFQYITIFGPPKVILSDQGSEFVNEVITEMAKLSGIERRVTSSYHPRTNGLTERFNQTLTNALKKHAEAEPQYWDKWIPYILMAYRSRIHSSTGYSPFEMLFGRVMNEFGDWSGLEGDLNEEDALRQRAKELKHLFEQVHPKAKETLDHRQKDQIKSQQRRGTIVSEPLKKGTDVLIRAPRKAGKMQARFIGPYKIDGITTLGNYWLANSDGERMKTSYPITKLKIARLSEDSPSEDSYEVEEILDHKVTDGQISYFVKWKDYPIGECSWVPETHFDTIECIEEYWRGKHTVVEGNDLDKEGDL